MPQTKVVGQLCILQLLKDIYYEDLKIFSYMQLGLELNQHYLYKYIYILI